MNRRRVTIEDVAAAANVSRQTVSRVINNKPNVKAAVRARVEQAIATLGYVPNTAARRMGGARSYLLLAVVERGAVASGAGTRTGRLPLDEMLLCGLEACAERGYHLLFEQLDDAPDASLTQLGRALTALSPDGVILTPPLDERADLIDAVKARSIAIESLSERAEFGQTVPGLDDAGLGEAAANHLIEQGHRQIGYVTGSADTIRSGRRLAGYRRAMAQCGSRAHRHFVCDEQLGFAEALALARGWLVPTIRPTAIIADTEEVALAILDVAHELEIEVPRDLSLLSLEDRASLTRAAPPVSALFHPYGPLFALACERLIGQAEPPASATGATRDNATKTDPDHTAERYILTERMSTAKAPRAV